jgi:general secretion pathway protein F
LFALLDAGLTQVEAFETMLQKEQRIKNKQMLEQLITSLYEGRSLSAAMEQFPNEFPPLYSAIVKASERTGNIKDSLSRYISYQSQMDLVRKKIQSASIYPLVLLSVGGLVTMFLMVYVVPKFSQIYADIGHDLPFFSRLLMQWGTFFGDHKLLMIIVFALLVTTVMYAVSNMTIRQKIMRKLWELPSFGKRIRVYQLARFYRTLGMLLRGGVPFVSALDMVSGLLQPELQAQLVMASGSIREGKPISYSLEKHGLTTAVALRLLVVGERTGRMDEMADRIANFLDDEMSRWVDWFTRLFEPLLMAFIGLVIGLIVVMMYFPIFELAGSIQ